MIFTTQSTMSGDLRALGRRKLGGERNKKQRTSGVGWRMYRVRLGQRKGMK